MLSEIMKFAAMIFAGVFICYIAIYWWVTY